MLMMTKNLQGACNSYLVNNLKGQYFEKNYCTVGRNLKFKKLVVLASGENRVHPCGSQCLFAAFLHVSGLKTITSVIIFEL